MNSPFVLGFDPIFLDVIVTPLDKDNAKLNEFPIIGEHITNTNVKFIPGGNSLNVAKILSKLTSNVYFFGAINPLFMELIRSDVPHLLCKSTSERDFNVTVALQFKSGEIQMNSLKSSFSSNDLNFESLYYLTYSRIIPFSNIGLNLDGVSLFDELASYFIELSKFFKINSESNENLSPFIAKWLERQKNNNSKIKTGSSNDLNVFKNTSVDISSKIFYFDPSSLLSFKEWNWLDSFFKNLYSFLPGFKIISLNEHEFSLMTKNNINFNVFLRNENNFLIIHESDTVNLFTKSLNNKKSVSVPKINENLIKSSVGAGDAFNAGLLFEFSKSNDIISGIINGIKIAQQFLTDSLP